MKKIKNNFSVQRSALNVQRGFTLMEVIVAISLITVGILGAYALITKTVSLAAYSSQRLVASYLAQEGIEIVRNIRDTNWLEGVPSWDDGIAATSDYQLDYQSSEFPDTTCNLGSGNYLRYDGNFYNCSSGAETKFKREIIISQPGTADCPIGDCLNISVLVEWQEKGVPHQITALEDLYNWK